ncbi:MAG: hypothetical protein ACM3S2_20095 [Ignavibacteriales bacterium]
MELDDFRKDKWPASQPGNESAMNQSIPVSQFVGSFKTYINNTRKKSLLLIGILLALSIMYISRINQESGLLNMGYGLITMGCVLGAVYLYFGYKPLPVSFYSLSTIDFLKKAEQKLQFMRLIDWLIIVPVLLILGTGGGIVFTTVLSKYTDDFSLLLAIWIVFFISLSVFGFYAGRKQWKEEHGQMIEEIRNFKNSLSGEDN